MPAHTAALVLRDSALQGLDELVDRIPGHFSKDSLADLSDVEYLLTGWGSPRLDEAVLQACPHLKAVFHCAGSVNPYTSEAFWESDIPITSAYHANSIPVAEFTYAQIVLALKGYWHSCHDYQSNRCIPADRKVVPGTRDATIGLISLGSIARLLLSKLRALDVTVIAYDPYLAPADAELLGVELVELDALFRRSHVVSCHAPLTAETTGMIGEQQICAMPKKSTLINTSRGKVFDAAGLARGLHARPDVYALLDVTDPEPLPADDPLFDLPNACISAHIAGSVGNECFNLGEAMVEELKRFLAGRPLEWEIKRERALMMT